MGKKRQHTFGYDLIVIGSGAAGNVAALVAAKSGLTVAIIESDKLGGSWPNYTDVPVGAVLKSAILYDRAKKGSAFGLRTATIGYNFPALKAWKDSAIKATGATAGRKYYESLGIDVFSGLAHFLSPNEITVNRKHLSAKKFLIATGSEWDIPAIPGLETLPYLTPKTALDINRLPKSLLIIGDTTIALELAQLFSLLGTKVYFAQTARTILPEFDKDVSDMAEKVLTRDNKITFLTQTKVEATFKDGNTIRAVISRGGTEKTLKVDQVLIANKKAPNIDLGLKNANVAFNKNGIEVDDYFKTTNRNIYAVGDVIDLKRRPIPTHVSLIEGKTAVNNIINRKKIPADYFASPVALFTHPGIATVGVTERQARAEKRSYRARVTNMNEIARTTLANYKTGMVKIITEPDGTIIGGAVISPYAGELINELALAVRSGMNVSVLAESPHAFLTWGESIRITADKFI